jgi:membrane protein DedA with SNARE-associated domain
MMLLSAIGLPFPEEATLVSVGILAYMGAHPDRYPPPFPGAPYVHAETAAITAFVAVLLSDFLIYGIGRMFGRQVFDLKPMRAVLSEENRQKIEVWTKKYGAYACGIFRFTPGIRFPGHLACGMLRFPAWKFGLIDGIAALISVPTQILLLKQFKIVVLCLLTIVLLAFVYNKWIRPRFKPS